MLQGEFRHTVDAKGRFFFPAPLKDEIGESPVICRGIDRNMMFYTRPEWEAFAAKIRALPFNESKKLTHFFISKSSEVPIDAQGRMVIPQMMREYAGIGKNVVIVGAVDSVEIWDEDTWRNKMDELSGDDVIAIMERNNF